MTVVNVFLSVCVPELGALFGSPPYDAWTTTLPGCKSVRVTEQLRVGCLPLESVHAVAMKETDPVPLRVQVTVPVGEYPVTRALQVTVPDEAAGRLAGLQETLVFEVLIVTTKSYASADGGFLESPP